HVCFHAGHHMGFDPFSLLSFGSVLYIEPTNKPRRAKARGISRKNSFHGLERQGSGANQVVKDRRESGILQELEDAVVRNQPSDVALCVSLPEVGHKTSRTDGRIDLEYGAENSICQRHAGL